MLGSCDMFECMAHASESVVLLDHTRNGRMERMGRHV